MEGETQTPLNPPLKGGKLEESAEANHSSTNELPLLTKERVGVRLDDIKLPWDHLDTGIDKQWLKDDLERALQEATVPDCAFDGCSSCGVCEPAFGHNIVVTPPPIPDYVGDFKPNQEKAQKIRVWFGKQGDMALLSHLDLARLFDRAVRRAGIPITYTGGFHP